MLTVEESVEFLTSQRVKSFDPLDQQKAVARNCLANDYAKTALVAMLPDAIRQGTDLAKVAENAWLVGWQMVCWMWGQE